MTTDNKPQYTQTATTLTPTASRPLPTLLHSALLHVLSLFRCLSIPFHQFAAPSLITSVFISSHPLQNSPTPFRPCRSSFFASSSRVSFAARHPLFTAVLQS